MTFSQEQFTTRLFEWLLILALVCSASCRYIEDDKVFEINKSTPVKTYSSDFLEEDNSNEFKIKLASKNLLDEQNVYILLESDNREFYLNIWTNESRNKKTKSLKVGTYSGNALFILSSGLFKGQLDYVKQLGKLYFGLKATNTQKAANKTKFKLKVMTGKTLELALGKTYTSMVDDSVSQLNVDLKYDGLAMPDLKKLRFQMTSIRTKPGWKMAAKLNYGSKSFQMNTIFKKSVGGILTEPLLPICHDKECVYTLQMSLTRVHMFNIETFLIGETEKLSINHYEAYYDKVYNPNQVTIYELPFDEEMENLDISISLTPVANNTNLYINPNTLPSSLKTYNFSEKGHLAKRITIKWEELVQMKAEKTSLFIAVESSLPGEFLLKIDAHDQGVRGTLEPGVIESGMVKFDEIANYMYMFEVIETQDITFDVKLNVNSGDGDLYLMQCSNYSDCQINLEQTKTDNSNLIKIANTMTEKDIKHTFTCQKVETESATICQFVVGVKGKENHGTHYEISLRESLFHRLVIPGHSVSLEVEPLEKTYLKLSFPHKSSTNSKLYLSIESLWGSFNLDISKTEEYPFKLKSDIHKSFDSANGASLNSLQIIEMDKTLLSDGRITGSYYVAIEAYKESALNLKFYEKTDSEISIHTLTAGKQVRGHISGSGETVYYSIRVSLDDLKASSVVVNLTAIKGTFMMFANRNGSLPSLKYNEYFSENSHLELNITENKKVTEEFFIGVQLHNPDQKEELKGNFQFLLSLSYANKPVKLNPGILASHTMKQSNVFLIRILKDFKDLLILKSIVDGYNIELCGKFTTTETVTGDMTDETNCDYTANEKAVSLYIKKAQLTEECERIQKASANHKPKCYFMVSLSGFDNQAFRLGYTYNDKPFHLVKGHIINGPWITNSDAQINFIYHPENNKSMGMYFNSKGAQLNLYSKLVDSQSVDDSVKEKFPCDTDHDTINTRRIGYVENVFYTAKEVKNIGNDPELLLSVQPNSEISNEHSDIIFDARNSFILQTGMDCIEIMRTQSIAQQTYPGEWNYYSFYNNGNTDSLKIYIVSEVATAITTMISLGLTSRPPLTNKPLITKTGIGSVEIDVQPEDLNQNSTNKVKGLKGHFVVGVKTAAKANINVYWNNKEDLNYLELTPNEPTTMLLGTDKKFYFAFYARDADGTIKEDSGSLTRKDIRVYMMINVKATIYVLKSPTGELDAPGPDNFLWKTTTAKHGGISMVEINAKDPNYCVDCLYIGYVHIQTPGQISILANIKHDKIPIHLKPGFTFPEFLESDEASTFRILNPDTSPMDLTFSMLSGVVNIYVGREKEVSSEKYDEMYSMESDLNVHKYIQLNPKKYHLQGINEWFIKVENPKRESSSFTLIVDKNEFKSPLEPGITKVINLGPGEYADMYYKPKEHESTFELRMILDRVLDPSFTKQALVNLEKFVNLYEIDESGKILTLKAFETKASSNQLYLIFKIPQNSSKTFGVKITNPIASRVTLKLDLLNGNYKLVNFNTYNLGMVKDKKEMIYEAYGIKDKYLFVDIRKCYGSPKVSFYQTDYQNVEEEKKMKYKVIRDENSFIQYVKLDHQRVFIKVENLKGNFTAYTLNAFSEKDMDLNPYSEITQQGNGQVDVETDSKIIRVKPLLLQASIGHEFVNKIVYSVYLSPSIKVMRYAKNCGKHMMHKAFEDPEILEFTYSVEKTHADIQNAKKEKLNRLQKMMKKNINIKIDGLEGNTKYYGIVVARVDLYPVGDGYLTPVRSGKAYYDEFTLITPRMSLPIQMIISILIIFGVLSSIFYIIKSYIFGNINQLSLIGERIPSSLKEFEDEGSFGSKAFSLLEEAYRKEEERMEREVDSSTAESEVSDTDENHKTDIEDPGSVMTTESDVEIELAEQDNDTSTPLDG